MTVRLNIILDDDVYRRIKRQVPPKKLSAFLNEAARAHLYPGRAMLDKAYKAAAAEPWRKRLSEEWSTTDSEQWPE